MSVGGYDYLRYASFQNEIERQPLDLTGRSANSRQREVHYCYYHRTGSKVPDNFHWALGQVHVGTARESVRRKCK